MLLFWVACNVGFALVVLHFASKDFTSNQPIVVNDGSIGFLEIFASYLASLVFYRVFFGGLHILKFKFMSNCLRKYKVKRVDLSQEVKRLRKITQDWSQSVAERESEINILPSQQAVIDDEDPQGDELLSRCSQIVEPDGHLRATRAKNSLLEKTYIDSDDDDKEFEDARHEEEEDQREQNITAFMISKTNRQRYESLSKLENKFNVRISQTR